MGSCHVCGLAICCIKAQTCLDKRDCTQSGERAEQCQLLGSVSLSPLLAGIKGSAQISSKDSKEVRGWVSKDP